MGKVHQWALFLSVLACQTLFAAGTLQITAYINQNSKQVVTVELSDGLVEEITYAEEGTKVKCIVYSAFQQKVDEQARKLEYDQPRYIAITHIGLVEVCPKTHLKLARLIQIDPRNISPTIVTVQGTNTDQEGNNIYENKRPCVVIRGNSENRSALVTYGMRSDISSIPKLSEEEYVGLGRIQVEIQDPVVYLLILD